MCKILSEHSLNFPLRCELHPEAAQLTQHVCMFYWLNLFICDHKSFYPDVQK